MFERNRGGRPGRPQSLTIGVCSLNLERATTAATPQLTGIFIFFPASLGLGRVYAFWQV
jgi:hypothetical protein